MDESILFQCIVKACAERGQGESRVMLLGLQIKTDAWLSSSWEARYATSFLLGREVGSSLFAGDHPLPLATGHGLHLQGVTVWLSESWLVRGAPGVSAVLFLSRKRLFPLS